MNHPKIGDARKIVESRGAVAGIVILFYEDAETGTSYGLASYGVDKLRCGRVAQIADLLGEAMEAGMIHVPNLRK